MTRVLGWLFSRVFPPLSDEQYATTLAHLAAISEQTRRPA